MTRSNRIAALTAIAVTALPAGLAQAHVTIQPRTAQAGGYVVENVRVPNERDDAATTRIDVQLPDGFAAVSYQATPGWKVTVKKETLATPVKTDDGEVTEGVRQITWAADSKADGIQPGEFRDFPLSLRMPDRAGEVLTFKAVQRYSNGEVVRWIGPESADSPAPTVALAAAASDVSTPAASEASDDDGGSNGLAIAALAVAVVAALLAGGGLYRRRTA